MGSLESILMRSPGNILAWWSSMLCPMVLISIGASKLSYNIPLVR